MLASPTDSFVSGLNVNSLNGLLHRQAYFSLIIIAAASVYFTTETYNDRLV